MEIEENIPEEKKQNSDSPDELSILCQVLGIKLTQKDLEQFKDISGIVSLIDNIKFTDKKKNELKDSMKEDLKNLQDKESTKKFSEDRSKKFSEVVKLNNRTTTYHTAQNDELSATMRAYYFRDNQENILSDKQRGEYRALHFENNIHFPKQFSHKEEDTNSNQSNIKLSEDKCPIFIKKRKGTGHVNTKNIKKKKVETRNNSTDNNNSRVVDVMDGPEAEYCIERCKYERKSKGQPMIQCDQCKVWYHTKCLNFTNEQFQKYDVKGKIWLCPKCSKKDEKKNDSE